MRSIFRDYLSHLSAILALVLSILCLGQSSATAQSQDLLFGPARLIMNEPSYLEFGAGVFNLQSHRDTPITGAGSIEYHYGRKLFWLGPTLGLVGNQSGGLLSYAGIYSDIKIAPFVITPAAEFGVYRRGKSLDLGGPFAFRLSIAAAYQFNDFSLVGVKFSRVSNAGIYNRNPGINDILLTYTIPIPEPF